MKKIRDTLATTDEQQWSKLEMRNRSILIGKKTASGKKRKSSKLRESKRRRRRRRCLSGVAPLMDNILNKLHAAPNH